MAKRRPPLPRVRPAPRVLATPAVRAVPSVDPYELATAAFVVALVLAPDVSPALFAHAEAVVATTAVFEFSMGLLAICAEGAVKRASRAQRVALVALGAAGVAAAGVVNALALAAPGLVVPGLWIVASRVRKPAAAQWFDATHCRTIAYEAQVAWATFVVAMLALFGLAALFHADGEPALAQPGVYAVVWGAFYVTLAFAMPRARRAASLSHGRR